MGKMILTVDESATVRQLLGYVLKGAGYEVVEAGSRSAAIEHLDSDQVKMLITGLNLPDNQGIDLIRHVRGSAQTRFLPIIMLTGERDEQGKQEGKLAGASGWIVKPFDPEQLLSLIKMIMV